MVAADRGDNLGRESVRAMLHRSLARLFGESQARTEVDAKEKVPAVKGQPPVHRCNWATALLTGLNQFSHFRLAPDDRSALNLMR